PKETWVEYVSLPNGDGPHQHPTPAPPDAYTIRRRLNPAPPGTDLARRHDVIVGDVLHSRAVRSHLDLLSTRTAPVTPVATRTPASCALPLTGSRPSGRA